MSEANDDAAHADIAETPAPRPTIDADGIVRADGVEIRLSRFLSAAARAQIVTRMTKPAGFPGGGIAAIRAWSDAIQHDVLSQWLALRPATVTPETIGGVSAHVITPAGGIAPAMEGRVLINLHGGGFFAGARHGGPLESVPLAVRAGVKVVAVDYRLAPEHSFPAASEDVEAVYTALLADHAPSRIGLCGTSAGGTLAAQTIARLLQRGLPLPGAIGLFATGLLPTFWYGGDSGEVTPIMNGQLPSRPTDTAPGPGQSYFAGADPTDPQVVPGLHPDILARFPPTLTLTSTRDVSMSNALASHARLLEAGVDAQLFVQEGLGHGEFNLLVGTPEAELAYDVIARFFEAQLSRAPED